VLETRASPVRAVLRFVASVMMVSGTLLIADAGVTLLLQEPVSSFTAHRQQVKLQQALAKPPPRVVHKHPLPGDAIGKIDIPAIDVSRYVVQGTRTGDLRKGPGHYPKTPLPGDRGTVAIAGHRTTYGAPFRKLNEVKPGQRVILEMPYGTYVYHAERTRIVPPTALWVTRKVRYERLVLTACHPLYSAAQRIVLFAKLVRRGPPRVRG
jgi:sortase A